MVRYEDLVREPDNVQARIEARFPFLQRRRAFSRYPEGADVPEVPMPLRPCRASA